jgi:hypothetical protein
MWWKESTAKAFELAINSLKTSNSKKLLAEIYNYSFARSGFFKNSRIANNANQHAYNEIDFNNALEGTRRHKILKAMGRYPYF